ncbi:MAG TPA: hypothetical protein VFL47_13045 [Flavisolibacter sp.]|nr:hypothetical protein [Flavisolibacter sp.]
MKTSVICTLFENTYHYGVAALVNSLGNRGFQGEFFAGYRGEMPAWAKKAAKNEELNWPGAQSLQVKEGFLLHFLPLTTDSHLTNYKPDFMLQLWEGPASQATHLFYLDPDIVVETNWPFFEEWAGCGIAVCEDVNSPMGENHPRRRGWRHYFQDYGVQLQFKESAYANGGFVGVSDRNKGFLHLWQRIQDIMAYEIGGLHNSQFGNGNDSAKKLDDPFYMFSKTDQDALNAALEAWEGDVSFVGKEAMGFGSSASLLPHAVGSAKPWNSNPLWMALKGYPPRQIDRSYHQNSRGYIAVHSKSHYFKRKIELRLAGMIGRFYKRS